MPRTMVYDIDVAVPAADLHRDFTGVDYWEQLVGFYESNGARTELAHFQSSDAGTDIAFSHILTSADFPAVARPVLPSTFVVTREQHFDPFEPSAQRVNGSYRAVVPTVPVDIRGEYLLSDTATGSRMRLQTQCTVRAPIIGGQIEQLILGGMRTLFAEEGRFTSEWVTRHNP
ncbi:MAG: DUF2505 domain-containing protein [Mycobacteriaceae bacterium]